MTSLTRSLKTGKKKMELHNARYLLMYNLNSINNIVGAIIRSNDWLCSQWCIAGVHNSINNNLLFNNTDHKKN